MNSSCPMGAFDQGPSPISWTIRKSKLSFQTIVEWMGKNINQSIQIPEGVSVLLQLAEQN